MIEYNKILNKNMINVLKDILKKIKDTGLSNNNHLYITFSTIHNTVKLPNWIRKKYPEEMTIVIQYEYYDLEVNNRDFSITLSFNAIISFADPSENFGLILQKSKIQNKIKTEIKSNKLKENNVINFSNYKKNQSK